MSKALRQFLVVCALACAALGQSTGGLLLQVQNQGSLVATWKKYGVLNCGTNLTCTVSGSTVTMAASAATPTYPVTVSGTVNSGGIPYFSSTTQQSSSATLTAHGTVLGEGAAAAPITVGPCGANFPLIGVASADPVCSPVGYLNATQTQGALLYMSTTSQINAAAAITVNKLVKGGGTGSPSSSSITDGGTANLTVSTNVLQGTNTVRLTANSAAITALTPGTAVLTFNVLPVSTNMSFACHMLYNQQTAAVAGTGFAIQGATNAPTRIDAWANMFTSQAGAQGEGTPVQNLNTTTATSLVTGTPSAINTVFMTDIYGTLQNGASPSTLTILAFTGNAADSITIQAGSYCMVTP